MGSSNMYATKPLLPESGELRLHVHPQLLFSGFLFAALFTLLEFNNYPLELEPLKQQGMVLILPVLGSLVSAVLLIVLSRRSISGLSSRINAKATPMVFLAVSLLTALLLVLTWIPFSLPLLAECTLFLVGVTMPVGLLSWANVFRYLAYRNILLNSALAYLVFSVAAFFSQELFPQYGFLLCAAYLLLGSVSLLMLKGAPFIEGGNNTNSEDSDSNFSPLQFLLSIPLTGIAMYATTRGIVYLGGSLPLVPTLVKWVAAALILILFAVTSFSKTPERRLTFLAYGIWVPAVAGIALFIKTIPIDFVTTIIFREFMEFYFQILILSLWTYLVSLLRSANLSPVYFSAIAQITFSLFLLFGYVIQTLGYPLNTTVLGVITACFLIYAIITVGRNIILSSKGPESEVEIPQSPLSIEATCNAIGLEYRLSPREVEVLKELAHGHASSYVAKVLYISNNTARSHMKNIYKKLEISSREELLKLIWKGQ